MVGFRTMIKEWIKCQDNEGDIPWCIFALDPKPHGCLKSESMSKLGYITCKIDDCHYLKNAIRPCLHYKREK